MNADELADEIGSILYPYCEEAATMLRQQKTEIEKLKDEVAMWKMSYENSIRFEDGYGHN